MIVYLTLLHDTLTPNVTNLYPIILLHLLYQKQSKHLPLNVFFVDVKDTQNKYLSPECILC